MPRASVVMPYYNNAAHIRAAVESYLAQTEGDIEIVAFGDGSTDGSGELLRQFGDERLIHVQRSDNRGISSAYNGALALATANCICFAGADDVAEPDRVARTLELLREAGDAPALVVADVTIIDAEGRPTGEVYGFPDHVTEDNVLPETLKRNYFLGASMAVNRVPGLRLDETLPAGDDFDVALRLLTSGVRWLRSRRPLVRYRLHRGNFSRGYTTMKGGAQAALRKYPETALRDVLTRAGRPGAEIDIALAIVALFLDDVERADRILATVPDGPTPRPRLDIERDFYKGVVDCRLGRLEAALGRFAAVVAADPRNPAALNNLGVLTLRVHGDAYPASELLRTALRCQPGYADAQRNLEALELLSPGPLKLTERLLASVILHKAEPSARGGAPDAGPPTETAGRLSHAVAATSPAPEPTVASIKDKIRRMGVEYRPGNASKAGHLYSPIPFPEFADVPYQREAVEERFRVLEAARLMPFSRGRLLDLGCHAGYNCFRFAEQGYVCVGVELDPLTLDIAEDVNRLHRTGIEFINAPASIELVRRLGHFDITLFLATFQWVVYAEGFDAAVALLAEVQAHCDVLFFETSMGQEGKMKLPQLPSPEAVHALLRRSGHHSQVDCLGAVRSPGTIDAPPRYLFRSASQGPAKRPDLWAMDPGRIAWAAAQAEAAAPAHTKKNEHFASKVYRVTTPEGRQAALKIVQPSSPLGRALLPREHEFLAAVHTRHVPELLGFGFAGPGYYLVTSWVEGPTLGDVLAAGSPAPALSDPDARGRLQAQIEEAVSDIESAGIRHRDIRPKNIILSDEGPVLIDFGWACWADEAGAPAPDALEQPDDRPALSALLKTIGSV